MNSPTPKEIAREARAALEKSPETPREHYDRLVRRGWINTRGEVTRILGGEAEPEAIASDAAKSNGNGHS